MTTKLTIHGHFYQPPRENPWTEVVETEPSAAPSHDWNERIYQECYRANDNARIMRFDGVVEELKSNYHYLSFNMGPTLLSWMQAMHPIGYHRLLQADAESVALRGYGNAIAQAYNHCILTLCNERDRRTQIKWGLADFRTRFGRDAASMWLPETACNDAVLGDLIDHGMKYCLLAPRQAERVREMAKDGKGEGEWREVNDNNIDPGLAYRYFHRDGSGRHIDLFFYDGPIAQAIAFENALHSSHEFISLFKRAQGGEGRLVHVATDGESYGHHTKYGERALAYAMAREAAELGFEVTNYEAYLAQCPPTHEVEVKVGPNGEGSSWSCVHGAGRWTRDCGCSTGAQEGWNQAWRAPLREALDILRDALVEGFEREAGKLLKDPWAARDTFIDIVLDPSAESKDRFFAVQASRPLDADERVRALTLLDMQRQCMLMYTSCGWFFNDLAGIETVQILKYACRAMDYAADLGIPAPRTAFLSRLALAHSNVAEHGNGSKIFHRQVEPLRVDPERLAAHLGLTSLVDGQSQGQMGGWDYNVSHFERLRLGSLSLASGRVEIQARITGRSFDASFISIHFGGVDLYCAVKRFEGLEAHQAQVALVESAFLRGLVPGILAAVRQDFGGLEYGLEQVLPDGRERLGRAAFSDLIENLSEQTARIYQDNKHRLDLFLAAGYPLPTELRTAAEFTLSRQFEAEIRAQGQSRDPAAYSKAITLAREANELGYKLDTHESQVLFTGMVTDAVRAAMEGDSPERLQAAMDLLKLTKELGIGVALDRAQEIAYRAHSLKYPKEKLEELAHLLWLAPDLLTRKAAL
jgi:alpha-amylase/alpha-mannosidase (GH57 family)